MLEPVVVVVGLRRRHLALVPLPVVVVGVLFVIPLRHYPLCLLLLPWLSSLPGVRRHLAAMLEPCVVIAGVRRRHLALVPLPVVVEHVEDVLTVRVNEVDPRLPQRVNHVVDETHLRTATQSRQYSAIQYRSATNKSVFSHIHPLST